jgi:hypothetical protein
MASTPEVKIPETLFNIITELPPMPTQEELDEELEDVS